ncbi:MAG: carboxypeptidase regulatory-like domain-containing protein [Acidobacteriota bacterium]|nr:carboxypeptidase regulatory-like domain-containing protein [Acidobacteriota bacterium]
MTLISRASMLLVGCCLLSVFSSTLSAQEFRATVNGRVMDAAGAAMPGVTVTARNTQSNQTATATTGGEGNYAIPFLQPGTYDITAEMSGFKRSTRSQQVLSVGQTATIDIQLEVGDIADTVTVVGDTALLDESKADRGMVIDNTRITELPLNARNPFMLSTLSAGITYNGPAIYQRPFDNGAIADWSINGGQNRNNEFLLDGAPNNSIQGGNNIAYVPPVDSVGEFKIITNGYDAQYGRSAGGTVNVSTKSGGNDFHGTVYEFARRKWLDANYLAFKAQKPPRDKPAHFLDQYGFEIDGPVFLPRFGEGGSPWLYNGKNKTFFMFNYEGYNEGTPNPATLTYPDEKQRRGDFSDLRDSNDNLIQIYDPNTGTDGSNRTPFPGNIIPANRINAIAQQLLNFYPLPNSTPPSGSDRFRNNYFFAPNVAADTFRNYIFKIDQNFGDSDKLFFRYGYNKRTESRIFNGISGNPAEDSQGPLERVNYTGVVDYVKTLSPSAILNLRVGANRYIEAARTEIALGFDPATLGFPASYAADIPIPMFPRFNFADYQNLGRGGFNREPTNVYSFQPNMTLIRGSHTTRLGLDMRLTQYAQLFSGRGAGEFNFNRNLTRRNFNNDQNQGRPAGVAEISGNSIASFLLGAPASVFVENNVFPIFIWKYYAPWVQDDWKITRRLTLNIGLRWDFNSPIKERFNRLNYGFDPNVVNPVSAQIDQTRFPGLQVKGGVGFAGVNGNPEYPYKFDKNNIQPRAGFAYSLTDRTVIRGGYGRYYLNPTGTTTRNGFSGTTDSDVSPDGGRTSNFNFSNPFPNGLIDPLGSAGGLLTFVGRSPNFSSPNFKIPYVHQFSFGVQRLLPFSTVLEVSYVGSRTRDEQSSFGGYNEPSLAFRNQCDPSKGGNPAFCDQQLPNPFRGIEAFRGTSRFSNATLSRYDLARPFPQFGSITQFERNDGRIWYNSLQVVANKRLTRGVTVAGTYTFSKMIEENGFLDNVAGTIQRSVYFSDRPHRVTASGVWELPIGKGKMLFGDANGFIDRVIGGIEFAGSFIYQSGRPWDLPGNAEYVKNAENPDPEKFRGNNNQFNPADYILGITPCVGRRNNNGTVTLIPNSVNLGCTEPNFIIRANFEERRTAFRDSGLRRPSFTQFDMNFAKRIRIRESMNVQLRAEFFNVTNTPMYDERNFVNNPDDPQFGRINKITTTQSNFPRQIQLAVKFNF